MGDAGGGAGENPSSLALASSVHACALLGHLEAPGEALAAAKGAHSHLRHWITSLGLRNTADFEALIVP